MKKNLHIFAMSLLALAALSTWLDLYAFAQTRFFTIDEYQYGHATWLVAHGAMPYVDFFEHHFPLSYVMHAPIYWIDWDFVTGALLLRKIVFAYLLALSLLAGFFCYRVTGNAYAGLLTAFLPPTFGFSLISVIDYRADNFAAFYFGACLVLLEWNRKRGSTRVAVVAGLLATLASYMTQKMTFVAGLTLLTMLVFDSPAYFPGLQARLDRLRRADSVPFIAHPGWFFGSVFTAGFALLGGAGLLGIVPAGFETTIVQAIEHERIYPGFSLFGRGYVTPFWDRTYLSTIPILLFALGYLVTRAGRFWLFPVAVSVIAGWLMVAPYPYNFVFVCWVALIAAVRGFCNAVEWIAGRFPSLDEVKPLLHLVAISALIHQLAFVEGLSTNAHQLRILAKIQKYGNPADAVIDNSGGAMFSWDGSYYFHHGEAHRRMFRDYFSTQLLVDYQNSRALFWIKDMRFKSLPEEAQDFLEDHYIHGGGDLWVIGFETPATEEHARSMVIDVIREGKYYFHRTDLPTEKPRNHPEVRINGVPLRGDSVYFQERRYKITVRAEAPKYRITPVTADFFDDEQSPKGRHYSMMFQYGQRKRMPSEMNEGWESEEGEPEIDEPETGEPETGEPEIDEPEIDEPEIDESEEAAPDAPSEVSEPEPGAETSGGTADHSR